MLEARPPPVPGLPQLLRPPSLHAALNTPVDWIKCTCWFLPCPCSLPRLIGGSASTTILSRPAQASLALRPARLLARPKADFCPEASTRPVARPRRSVAITSHRQLHEWILLPLVICAVGAHSPETTLQPLGFRLFGGRAWRRFSGAIRFVGGGAGPRSIASLCRRNPVRTSASGTLSGQACGPSR